MQNSAICTNCKHGAAVIDKRVFHAGITPIGTEYIQKLCWQPGCDCMEPSA